MITKNTITQGQLVFLIIQTQIGITLLSLPYNAFTTAKGDAWIATLLAGSIAQFFTLIIWLLCRRYPNDTIFTLAPKLMGKMLGNVLSFTYIIFFIAVATFQLVIYSRVLQKWVMVNTPLWITSLSMVITGIYISKQLLNVTARLYMFVSVFLIILVFLVTYSFKDANIQYILPIADSGWLPIFKGVKNVANSAVGFEILLVIYPFIQGKASGKLKMMVIANLLVTLFYTYVVFATLVYFSPQEMRILPEPVLYLTKSLSFHIIERTDLIFLTIWIIFVTTSFCNYVYSAASGLATLFRSKSHAMFAPFVGVIAFFCSLIPHNKAAITVFSNFLSNFAIISIFILPLFLLFVSFARNKKRQE
ncbi:GerAB/ArcD/ProY family transporter [Bacillus cereus group sp. BfR-BA-01538]|uniref:GerAB/ArcD/ProY family transporter n=1 Tax=Bacillus cereus group sp. BfR-BA-01538 TaxID=2920373 RepID=UPI001F58F798